MKVLKLNLRYEKLMKKIKANWYVALTYYVYANLIGFIPLFIASVLTSMFAKSPWVYAIVSVTSANLIYYFALKMSAKNINKNYVVPKISEIVTWTLYYLIILNGIFIFILIKSQGYFSLISLVLIINIIFNAIIVEKFTKDFLVESNPEEISLVTENNKNNIESKLIKKTWVIYTLLVVLGISVFLDTLALISGIFVQPFYGSYTILNTLAMIFTVPDIIFSAVYFYMLLKVKNNLMFWTNIVFGYSIVRAIFSIIADVIAKTGSVYSNVIQLIVVLIVWYLLYKYFSKFFLSRKDEKELNLV